MTGLLKIGGFIVGLLTLGMVWIAGITGGDEPAVTPTPLVEAEGEQPSPLAEEQQEPEVAAATDNLVQVTRIIDGDTIETEQGTVRLIGVDTPETVHPSKPVECMGKEASAKTKELLEGQRVRLEKDVSETDRYDRLLRYVYLEDGTFVNELLVREGFASAVSYPPDVTHQDLFREAEQTARENKWGLWSSVCASPETQAAGVKQTQPTKAPAAPAQPAATHKPAATKAPTSANCSADTYNCGDFNSCSEVMAVFNQCSGDPHGLDGDDDGIPCESLCG